MEREQLLQQEYLVSCICPSNCSDLVAFGQRLHTALLPHIPHLSNTHAFTSLQVQDTCRVKGPVQTTSRRANLEECNNVLRGGLLRNIIQAP